MEGSPGGGAHSLPVAGRSLLSLVGCDPRGSRWCPARLSPPACIGWGWGVTRDSVSCSHSASGPRSPGVKPQGLRGVTAGSTRGCQSPAAMAGPIQVLPTMRSLPRADSGGVVRLEPMPFPPQIPLETRALDLSCPLKADSRPSAGTEVQATPGAYGLGQSHPDFRVAPCSLSDGEAVTLSDQSSEKGPQGWSGSCGEQCWDSWPNPPKGGRISTLGVPPASQMEGQGGGEPSPTAGSANARPLSVFAKL